MRNGRVTIPARLRRSVSIEPGDYIEVTVQGDGLLLTPKKLIDKSLADSWTQEERNVGAHDKTLKDA